MDGKTARILAANEDENMSSATIFDIFMATLALSLVAVLGYVALFSGYTS